MTDLLPFLPPAGTLFGESCRGLSIASLLAVVMALAEWCGRRGAPVEWTRKLVHAASGLVAIALPWLVLWPATVLVTGLAAAVALTATRRLGWLNSVHGVARESSGEHWFPVAVVVLYVVGRDRPVFYAIALAVLLTSDSLAALLGSHYGQQSFVVEQDRRTLEGTLVFCVSAFLCAHLPLLLLTDLSRGATVLAALLVAVVATLFEAISMRGVDNLLVPISTFYVLVKVADKPVAKIGQEAVALLVVVLVLWVVALRLTFLTTSSAMVLMLFVYGAWALGGPSWIVAPGLALVGVALVLRWTRASGSPPRPVYHVSALFHAAITPAILLFLNNTFETILPPSALSSGDPFYPTFVGAIAGHVAIVIFVFRNQFPALVGAPHLIIAALSGLVATLLVVPVALVIGRVSSLSQVATCLVVACGAPAVYGLSQSVAGWPAGQLWEYRRQGLSVVVATLTALALVFGRAWS